MADLHAPDCASLRHDVHVASGVVLVAAQYVAAHCVWQTLDVHAHEVSAESNAEYASLCALKQHI